jgi:hypothetical protein
MNNITISKDKVLEAAKKCPQAKETLKILFPEVFEDDKYLDLSKLVVIDKIHDGMIFSDKCFKDVTGVNNDGDLIVIRTDGEYKQQGFWLSPRFNWEIVRDLSKQLVLLPTKKQ